MLDITKEDIQRLNDTDLRILIGKLCEAELYQLGIDSRGVSYGGNQDERDGGIDVKVSISETVDPNGFIFKNNTIFQVKKPSMPPNKIIKEMKNKDNSLKNCIKSLSQGAYVIVSSGDDLTELTYNSRITAMKSALKEINLENEVLTEFYDSNKIATWVRKFPGVICCPRSSWIT